MGRGRTREKYIGAADRQFHLYILFLQFGQLIKIRLLEFAFQIFLPRWVDLDFHYFLFF